MLIQIYEAIVLILTSYTNIAKEMPGKKARIERTKTNHIKDL